MHRLSAPRGRSGPFLLDARTVLVFSGVLAIVTGLIHLVDEVQLGESTIPFAVVVVVLSQVWLASLYFAWRGGRFPIAVAGLLAFAEFGNQASTHFAIGVNAIEFIVPTRGLGFAVDLLVLQVACLLCAVSAILCSSNPFGRSRRSESFPFLLVAIAGSSLVLLHAADDIGRHGFGALNVEDGLMVAVITATLWILGALWMASSPRLASLLVIAASANVVIPFVTLHLLPGGVSLQLIEQKSGIGAAVVAAAMATVAGATLIAAIVLLLRRLVPPARRRLGAIGKRRQAEARTKAG